MSTLPKDFTPLHRHPRKRALRIAERGISGSSVSEHALDALRTAANMQADMVKVDIQITLDERPVIAHDASLRRPYGIDQNIHDLTLKVLRSRTTTYKTDAIPTFEEAAFVCTALKIGLYLDLKAFSREAMDVIFATLEAYQLTDYVILGSSRPDWLAEIKALNPYIRTSILFSSIYLDAVKLAESIKADYVHPCWENITGEPHRLLTTDWLQTVRQAGLGILSWHEERPDELEALVQLGVDGICSERLDLLAQLIRDR